MLNDIILLEEFLLKLGIELVPGGTRVGKVGIASVLGRRDLNGAEKREARKPRVERRVHVEQSVALVSLLVICKHDWKVIKDRPFHIVRSGNQDQAHRFDHQCFQASNSS